MQVRTNLSSQIKEQALRTSNIPSAVDERWVFLVLPSPCRLQTPLGCRSFSFCCLTSPGQRWARREHLQQVRVSLWFLGGLPFIVAHPNSKILCFQQEDSGLNNVILWPPNPEPLQVLRDVLCMVCWQTPSQPLIGCRLLACCVCLHFLFFFPLPSPIASSCPPQVSDKTQQKSAIYVWIFKTNILVCLPNIWSSLVAQW